MTDLYRIELKKKKHTVRTGYHRSTGGCWLLLLLLHPEKVVVDDDDDDDNDDNDEDKEDGNEKGTQKWLLKQSAPLVQ